MKITNNHNLHPAIYKAICVNHYTPVGDISVTTLIGPPQVRILKLKHKDELTVDAMDLIWAVFGSVFHLMVEMADYDTVRATRLFLGLYELNLMADEGIEGAQDMATIMSNFLDKNVKSETRPNVLRENTMVHEVMGWELSGTFDRFIIDEETIQDYKTTSAYAFIYPEGKQEWTAQQNIYAFMLREKGYKVSKSQIIAVFRDWSGSNLLRNKDYPKHKSEVMPIELYDHEQMRGYIARRIELHQKAEEGVVPDCTPKERWNKPDSFAVMRKGAKKAMRVLHSKGSAEAYIKANQFKHNDMYIEQRMGKDTKCEQYCSVSSVCPQYAKIKAERLRIEELTPKKYK